MYIPVFEVPQPERLQASVHCKHGLHSIHEGLKTLLQERNLICQCNIFNDLQVKEYQHNANFIKERKKL